MRLFSFLFVLLVLAFPAAAEGTHTQVRLFSPVTAIEGGTLKAGIHIKLDDGWKTYWRTPGDAGLAPVFDWTGSENFQEAKAFYPAPYRFTVFDIDNLGYKHEVSFPLEIFLAEAGKAVSLKLKLDLLVCSDICVPETHALSLDLPAGVPEASVDAALYEHAVNKLPKQAEGDFIFSSAVLSVTPDNSVFLTVTAKTAMKPSHDAELFVEHPSNITFGKPEAAYDAKQGVLRLKASVHSTDPIEKLQQQLADAPIALTFADAGDSFEGSLTIAPELLVETAAPDVVKALVLDLRIILFALLGGLILNLMPCVLPVLSLKILSVMSHGGSENRKTIFRNFMASALGILSSFWLMAGILSGVKAAGGSVGWGIQFQHPAFLAFLIAAVTLFALNLWGLFEIPLPRFIAKNIPAKHEHQPTLTGHFLTGAFATLLATPCTAPFLGTAVGFALAGGVADIFAIFTFLGIGLALPYIVLAVSPRLFKYMPKPGRWMVTLKKALALALLLTAAWLINVLVTVTTQATLDAGWEKFDESRIAVAVEEGKTVVVDVTADWCLTCKANKRLVLEQRDVQEALAAENILLMQADWSHRDEGIAAYLRKYGKYGIPFNIVYGPAAPEGIVLPELLSKRAVMDALAIAAGE